LVDRVREAMNKGGRGVKSPLDSSETGQPPVARDVTAKYRVSVAWTCGERGKPGQFVGVLRF